ncbi:MAG: cell division protein SepF [Candidatus Bathyarchaeota archaeon]
MSVADGGGFRSEKPVTYIKAISLKDYSDVEKIKEELKMGNVLIIKITPLAIKNIEEVKNAIDELKAFSQVIDGDIARLGEERIVMTPSSIKIWRGKSPS